MVYDNLARHADGAIAVLTSYRDHRTGEEIAGWCDHDRTCGYPIYRTALVRPRFCAASASQGQGSWRRALDDSRIFGRLCWTGLRMVHGLGIGVICLGDLDTNGWLITPAQRLAGLRTILYIHGDEVSTNPVWAGQMHRRRRYLRAADAIVAVSQYAKNILVERYGVAPSHIELIPNGVDTEKFVPSSKPAALIHRFGLTDKIVLVTITRLVERKGVDMALRALPAVRAQLPNTHFLIVGDGPLLEQLRRIAAEQGVADAVTFVGEVPHCDTPAYYAAGDIFVMPNRRLPSGENEGFGLVFLEANACGLPVIAGRDGGPTNVVSDGVNGLLAEGSDPDAIAAAILRIATDHDLRGRLRSGGLAVAQQSNWPSRAGRFLALCDRLMRAYR